jgi:hypothetical protein
MNNLKRNKRKLWHCTKTIEDGKVIFTEPEKVLLNYQPIKSVGEILEAGPDSINTLIAYMRPSLGKKFHNGDRCYVFVEPPEEYDKTCNKADYYVDGDPKIYINEYTIHLQRMIGDEYGS